MGRRRRIDRPPGIGPVAGGEIIELTSEEEKAGRPPAPPVYPVMPPDTPPDVLAAMRASGALPPLPTEGEGGAKDDPPAGR